MAPFSIRESLRFGWRTTRAHSGLVFRVVLTLFALQVMSAVVNNVLADTLLGVAAAIVLAVLGMFLSTGVVVITLKLARGERAYYRDLLPPGRLVWRLFLASLLLALIVVGGFILLIIPGFYFLLRYSMVKFAVIDGAGVRESLRQSAALTRGVKGRLLGFFAAMALINLAGAVLLLVGLLVTIPVTTLAAAHVYLQLKRRQTA